jgi:hypothetical protein
MAQYDRTIDRAIYDGKINWMSFGPKARKVALLMALMDQLNVSREDQKRVKPIFQNMFPNDYEGFEEDFDFNFNLDTADEFLEEIQGVIEALCGDHPDSGLFPPSVYEDGLLKTIIQRGLDSMPGGSQ